MINAEDVVTQLKAQILRLNKLEGEKIGGFVLVIPPEGDPIAYTTLDDRSETIQFFQALNDKLKLYQANLNLGGVTVQGMPRRGF